ncbi:MAG: hypothetical protein SGBAC_010966 [Bacillariaceae sp.]
MSSIQLDLSEDTTLANISSSVISGSSGSSGSSEIVEEHDGTNKAPLFQSSKAQELNATRVWDTSIMITSNLIPTHPNIGMLKDTIFSLHQFLEGIPLDTPIYVVVDGLPDKKLTQDNQLREKQYIEAVRSGDFRPFINVIVAPMGVHRNLAGSVKYTLENYIQTEFLYIIQHDLPFSNSVDHRRVLKTMREHPDVLFNYYTFLLSNMKHHRRAMEVVMGWKARYNCTFLGQQVYGQRDDGQTHICHLNGRVSQSYNDANKTEMTGWEKKAIWCRNQVYRGINRTNDER